jgi:ribosomal protein L11 methyltransferase
MSSILGTTAGLGAGAGHCKTFILASDYVDNNIEINLNNLFNQYDLTYSKSIIKEENWNAIWESNFEPVRVDDFVGIRAHFHPHFEPPVQFEMNITPKMSFGTGHHGTTYTVMQMMQELDFMEKTVYDFGTGTGILAILAEKLGASYVLGVDNDDWCIENAIENIQNNYSKKVEIKKVATAAQPIIFDILLANVNRHIIEANIDDLTASSGKYSQLILSGLLVADEVDILHLAKEKGWNYLKSKQKNGWISLLFNKV